MTSPSRGTSPTSMQPATMSSHAARGVRVRPPAHARTGLSTTPRGALRPRLPRTAPAAVAHSAPPVSVRCRRAFNGHPSRGAMVGNTDSVAPAGVADPDGVSGRGPEPRRPTSAAAPAPAPPPPLTAPSQRARWSWVDRLASSYSPTSSSKSSLYASDSVATSSAGESQRPRRVRVSGLACGSWPRPTTTPSLGAAGDPNWPPALACRSCTGISHELSDTYLANTKWHCADGPPRGAAVNTDANLHTCTWVSPRLPLSQSTQANRTVVHRRSPEPWTDRCWPQHCMSPRRCSTVCLAWPQDTSTRACCNTIR